MLQKLIFLQDKERLSQDTEGERIQENKDLDFNFQEKNTFFSPVLIFLETFDRLMN